MCSAFVSDVACRQCKEGMGVMVGWGVVSTLLASNILVTLTGTQAVHTFASLQATRVDTTRRPFFPKPVQYAEWSRRPFGMLLQAPDLYLGYGAAKDSPPLYTFEYPASWEEEAPSKTTKSTMCGGLGLGRAVLTCVDVLC